MTFKWNWGTGLIFVYSGFVVFMLGMVYLCTQQHFDLVTPNYYEEELKFQQVIDGKQNEQLLGKATTVVVDKDAVTVKLPVDTYDGEGTVTLYRPDNAKYDMVLPLNGKSSVTIPLNKLKEGIYKVKASWQNEGKPYYNEQTLYIP
jgi:nitrogen fixation protein FixH